MALFRCFFFHWSLQKILVSKSCNSKYGGFVPKSPKINNSIAKIVPTENNSLSTETITGIVAHHLTGHWRCSQKYTRHTTAHVDSHVSTDLVGMSKLQSRGELYAR